MNAELLPETVFTVHALAPGSTSAADMQAWKSLVAYSVASGAPLSLAFFGGANAITAYRLFYMLLYAKEAGVSRLSLRTDGAFLNDEAATWLTESGVDEIILTRAGIRECS